ncbi:MAG: hypothetical protein ACI89L_002749 [Phycisphaerales bacterium]|jgi:hypothetical protein
MAIPRFWIAIVFLVVACSIFAMIVFTPTKTLLLAGPPVSWNPAASHNAEIEAIPESDRAWPIYCEARGRLQPLLDKISDSSDPMDKIRPVDPDWPQVVKLLEQAEPVLSLLREAGNRSRMGKMWYDAPDPIYLAVSKAYFDPGEPYEYSPNPALLDLYLDDWKMFRSLARTLVSDARFAVSIGDVERTTDDLVALSEMARLIPEPPSSEMRTGLANATGIMLFDLIGEIAEAGTPMGEADWARLNEALRRMAEQRPVASSFLDMRTLVWEDTLRRIFLPDGRVTRAGIWHAVQLFEPDSPMPELEDPSLSWDDIMPSAGLDQALASIHQYQSAFAAVLADPLSAHDIQLEVQPIAEHAQWLNPVLTLFNIDLLWTVSIELRVRTKEQATLLLIAIERHALRHSEWPSTLSEIDADLLSSTPTDGFTGEPLHYRLTDDGPVIYSVGADRNDDLGRPLLTTDGDAAKPEWLPLDLLDPAAVDGDWVLYPPQD